MRRQRQSEGFNLAFLDIMSCGLGAVILVFMLVKFQVDVAPPVIVPQQDSGIEELRKQRDELQEILQQMSSTYEADLAEISQRRKRILDLQRMIANKDANLDKGRSSLEKLKQDITRTPVTKKKEDVIQTVEQQEQNYIMGLRVEGRRIALLVDSSASMTAERLIDIIRLKNSSVQQRKQAAKWQRTVRTVRWLLARLPAQSEVALISFAASAKSLGTTSWTQGRDKNGINKLLQAMQGVTPDGGTNLQSGLKKVASLRPTDLYIVTDSLPTAGDGNFAGLNPFSSCRSLLGRASTISGECRVKLFRHTVSKSGIANVKVNVVLLPMEGDPESANEYWSWTAITGGLLIHPASNWP